MYVGPANQPASVASIEELSDDPNTATSQTIARMREFVLADKDSPAVRRAAMEAVGEYGAGAPIQAVFWYVKSRMQFVNDVNLSGQLRQLEGQTGMPLVEVLIRPAVLMQYWVGDCDDYVMLTAALLLALGVPCRFVTVAADLSRPNEYSHVYLAAYQGIERIALDTSHGPYPGWETDKAIAGMKTEWPIDTGQEAGHANSILNLIVGFFAVHAGWSLLDMAWARGKGRQ